MRLIDANALIAYCDEHWIPTNVNAVNAQPTVKERKKGEWMPFDEPWYQCSECGAVREQKSFMENYCPNCGADMRGERDETS